MTKTEIIEKSRNLTNFQDETNLKRSIENLEKIINDSLQNKDITEEDIEEITLEIRTAMERNPIINLEFVGTDEEEKEFLSKNPEKEKTTEVISINN